MPPRALALREGKAPVRDRLLTMLFLAALLHGLIILGLTFNSATGGKDIAPGLKVLLVSDEVHELALWMGGTANRNRDAFESHFEELTSRVAAELKEEKKSSPPHEVSLAHK